MISRSRLLFKPNWRRHASTWRFLHRNVEIFTLRLNDHKEMREENNCNLFKRATETVLVVLVTQPWTRLRVTYSTTTMLSLPPEISALIVSQIKKRDVASLAWTSHAMLDRFVPYLWDHVRAQSLLALLQGASFNGAKRSGTLYLRSFGVIINGY